MTTPKAPLVPQPTKRPTLKVWASTSGTFVGVTALLAVLQAAVDTNLIGTLPPVVGIPLAALAPTLLGFLAGYIKRNRALP